MCAVGRNCGTGRVAGPRKGPNGKAKKKTRCTMDKKIITKSVKVAVTAGALAAALTGCCMFGSGDCCCKKGCCKTACCCKEKCHGKKTGGVNTSMTVGVGTDGVRMGGDANVGNHGVSAGAGGGVR